VWRVVLPALPCLAACSVLRDIDSVSHEAMAEEVRVTGVVGLHDNCQRIELNHWCGCGKAVHWV
jgi:hypothetical protein